MEPTYRHEPNSVKKAGHRLALVVIARDEADTIERCLASAAGQVDHMLVLDTGSVDATPELAAAAGADVRPFEWCDDFSAARNAALEQADAEWNLVLDADEWLDAGTELLDAACLGTAPFLGVLPVTSAFDLDDKVESATSWIPRLLPAGVRYTGRIHEQPQSDLPRKRLAVDIRHDGYRREQLQRKAGRNRALLLDALNQSPQDAYLLYQTGKDFEVYGEYAQASEYYGRALACCEPRDSFRHDLVLRQMYSLKRSGQLQAAIQFADREMANWPESPDYYFTLGDLMLDWAMQNPDKAVQEILPMAVACWTKCLEIGERPELEGAVQGRGSWLAAHNLAVLYEGLGDAERTSHYRQLANAPEDR